MEGEQVAPCLHFHKAPHNLLLLPCPQQQHKHLRWPLLRARSFLSFLSSRQSHALQVVTAVAPPWLKALSCWAPAHQHPQAILGIPCYRRLTPPPRPLLPPLNWTPLSLHAPPLPAS
jgi:hypothetical protein